MCWVMPPASPAATSVCRIASRRDVLPWSTWPMTVTTGARGARGRRLLELEHLSGVVGSGLLGGATDRRLGDRARLGHRLELVARGLFDQGQGDVGVGVFLVGADELPQVDLVGDGDLRAGAAF